MSALSLLSSGGAGSAPPPGQGGLDMSDLQNLMNMLQGLADALLKTMSVPGQDPAALRFSWFQLVVQVRHGTKREGWRKGA